MSGSSEDCELAGEESVGVVTYGAGAASISMHGWDSGGCSACGGWKETNLLGATPNFVGGGQWKAYGHGSGLVNDPCYSSGRNGS
uniref:Uncharacterized protein n=1 Tax=Romanomermis culicivorax TaxID=13658 RepID=A0A915L4Z9_ROMCU